MYMYRRLLVRVCMASVYSMQIRLIIKYEEIYTTVGMRDMTETV